MADSDHKSGVNPLHEEEAILVLEQADLASQAQLPVSPGLRAMAEEASSARTRLALTALADRLDQGESMVDVLATLQPRLSPLMQSLIQQGVEIGRVDAVLHWAAEQSRRRRALQTQLWNALAYPLVLMVIAMDIGSFIVMWVVPMFKKIFDDFGTELPGMTIALMGLSDLGSNPVIATLFFTAPVILFGLILYALRGDLFVSQRWSAAIPLIGPLFRLSALADFCNLMAVFIDMRMPLHKAVRVAGDASRNRTVRAASEELATSIESGQFTPTTAIETGIPVAVRQMLHEATSAEALSEALHGIAEVYGARAELNSRAFGVVMEPFIFLGTTIGIGSVVIALFMPLIKLLNDLS